MIQHGILSYDNWRDENQKSLIGKIIKVKSVYYLNAEL